MAYAPGIFGGAGGGTTPTQTETLLTSSEELTTSGVYTTATRHWSFIRVVITRNSTTTQGTPVINISLSDSDQTNVANPSSVSALVNNTYSVIFYDVAQWSTVTVKRTSSAGSAARYSACEVQFFE